MEVPSTSDNGGAFDAEVPVRCIVPIDGLGHSERGLAVAARLAAAMGGAVDVVCYSHGPITSQFRRDLAALVDRAVGDVPARLEVMGYRGPVSDRIIERVAAHPDAVLCMAAHSRERAPGIVGSVTDAVVRAIAQPVVLVGPGAALGAFDPGGPVLSTGPDTDRLRAAAQGWARRFDSSVEHRPLDEALQTASTLGASVIAVSVPRLGRVDRLLHGSEVADLIHDAPCPVLAIGA
ncbi:MAG: universal stress protein [Acidimicrobiia bacterium]|nr:universal stress protein [Acidimicrobiia bacterium]MDH4365562.1 universal stress protein [Acidimicrobiia bacterium]MDH5290860.1 universal stress protein [Acidimicrobiia bacterium]